jgi:dienelactone hydrolase
MPRSRSTTSAALRASGDGTTSSPTWSMWRRQRRGRSSRTHAPLPNIFVCQWAGGCGKVFTVGFCFGGRNSWLAAAGGHGLAGAIGFYGSTGERNGEPGPTQRAPEFAAPILALQAGADEHILPEHNAAFAKALTDAGVEHELVIYEGAPHSFFDRRHEEFADASADAWAPLLSFIEHHETVRL